jgi:hypothetical protein
VQADLDMITDEFVIMEHIYMRIPVGKWSVVLNKTNCPIYVWARAYFGLR